MQRLLLPIQWNDGVKSQKYRLSKSWIDELISYRFLKIRSRIKKYISMIDYTKTSDGLYAYRWPRASVTADAFFSFVFEKCSLKTC